MMSKV